MTLEQQGQPPAQPLTDEGLLRRQMCRAAGLLSVGLLGNGGPAHTGAHANTAATAHATGAANVDAPGLANTLPPMTRLSTTHTLQAMVSHARHPLASLAVLAVRDGSVVFEAAFGRRDIAAGLPATPDTLYRIASISKLATAIGFMRLVESGQIDLDADVGRYLGTPLRNPAFLDEPISSRMLLGHTSSLRDVGDLFPAEVGLGLEQALKSGRRAEAGAHWASAAAEAPSRRFFSYANVNCVVLGTLIERVTGQRFDRYMKQHVFAPLRLRASFNTAEDFEPADLQQLATLYRKSPDQGRTWALAGPWVAQGPDRTGQRNGTIASLERYVVGSNAGVFGPQGGLRISVRGLGKLMRLMLGQGSVDDVHILRPQTVQAMLTPHWSFNGKPQAPNGHTYRGLFREWGLGPQLFTDQSGKPGTGDRIGSPAGGFRGAGHLGEAYGLLSGLVFDAATRNGMAYAIGGISADPNHHRGVYSAFSRWEETVLATLLPLALGTALR
ncbi:MAG TPA: serine hydrolase domain-containing protein [Rubrivivax sp.]|nr:serine hydrolase domain-containing protein [Rubrivivax sp.]